MTARGALVPVFFLATIFLGFALVHILFGKTTGTPKLLLDIGTRQRIPPKRWGYTITSYLLLIGLSEVYARIQRYLIWKYIPDVSFAYLMVKIGLGIGMFVAAYSIKNDAEMQKWWADIRKKMYS